MEESFLSAELTVTYFDGAVETSRLTDAAVSDVKPVPAFTACKAAR